MAGLEQLAYARSSGISVLEESYRTKLVSKGVKAAKIRVLPVCVDTRRLRPDVETEEMRTSWGANGKCVVLYGGTIGRIKSTDDIISAAQILEHRDDILFVIVAGGHTEAARLASTSMRNVVFRDLYPLELLPSVYAAGDICLVMVKQGLVAVPSKVFPIMACGRPIVASVSEDTDTARLLAEIGCGIVVHPGDAQDLAVQIERLADDPSLRARMGLAAREAAVKRFDRSVVAAGYASLIRDVLRY